MKRWLLLPFVLLLSSTLPACTPALTSETTRVAVTEALASSTHEPLPTATVIAVHWDMVPEALIVVVTACGGSDWDPCASEEYVPEAQIWGDGRMLLAQDDGTGNQQLQEAHLSFEEMTSLLQQIVQAGFFAWDEQYAADVPTDARTRCISVALVAQARHVCEMHRGAPPAFRALFDYITSGASTNEGSGGQSEDYARAVAALPSAAVVLEYELEFPSDAEAGHPTQEPQLTLLADGTLVYVEESFCSNDVCREQAMRVELSQTETISLLEKVRGLGFEQLESHTDSCYPLDDGSQECAEGGSDTALRLFLPSGTWHEVRFSTVADSYIENLQSIRSYLAHYRHVKAEVYSP